MTETDVIAIRKWWCEGLTMREMRKLGMSYRAIGEVFGCGERTVDYYLRAKEARMNGHH